MLQYCKENIQLFLILTVWLIVGIYGGPLIYGVLPITMCLMQRKDMYEELLLGYLFILILSDSQEGALYFAKEVKNIYISLLAVFIFIVVNKDKMINVLQATGRPELPPVPIRVLRFSKSDK